ADEDSRAAMDGCGVAAGTRPRGRNVSGSRRMTQGVSILGFYSRGFRLSGGRFSMMHIRQIALATDSAKRTRRVGARVRPACGFLQGGDMNGRGLLSAIAVAALCASMAAQQPISPAPAGGGQGILSSTPPLRIYIRAGLKTHGPGQHDYPQYLADWSKVLTERGAVVDGSLHFPTAAEIANTDVIVMYKGDAGGMNADEKATLEAYLKRGGGLVSLHDTLCGPDPDYYSTIVGRANMHRQTNFNFEAEVQYTNVDNSSAIMPVLSDFS